MKMRLPFSVFFLTGLLCAHFSCFAQDIHFNKVELPRDEQQSAIGEMAQDSQGFLWLATQHGLFKYDGFKYISYHNEALNPNSPASDIIWCVMVDKEDRIWLSPGGSGLDRLDPATGIFTHFRHTKESRSLSSDSVTTILQDHEGTIWVGTGRQGMDKYDNKTNKFIHYRNKAGDPSSISCNAVRKIYEDRQGTIWVGTGSEYYGQTPTNDTDGGLNKLDKKTGKFTRYLHDEKDPHSLIDNRVRTIFEDSRGTFWVGTAGDGLHTMDRATGLFERHLYDPSNPTKLSRPPFENRFSYVIDHISFIMEDNKGRIWIGAFEAGINVYDPTTQKCTRYGVGKDSSENIGGYGVWTACKTRDNVVWLSTTENNLYKIKPYDNKLPHINVGEIVTAIGEDDTNTLWIGTNKGLLHKGSKGQLERFMIDKDSLSLSNVVTFIEKVDKKFWLATLGGLYLFDPVTNKFSGYHHQPGSPNSLLSDTVLVVKKGVGDQLWMGCINGLVVMDTKTGNFKYLPDKSDIFGINNNVIGTIYIDKSQNLWLGTFKGLIRFDQHTGLFKKYFDGLTAYGSVSDSEGNFWAGTSAGLFKYNKAKDTFLSFTDESAIMSTSLGVGSLTEDHERNLWFTSTKGIVRLDKERRIAALYGKNQDVNVPAFTFFSHTRQNGNVLYTDSSGYFEISPALLEEIHSPPFVIISNFLLNNTPLQPAAKGILSKPLPQTKEIHLNHDQNTFAFEFANIDFISEHEDTRLLYRLQNYDDAWRKAGDERRAYYFNMLPGKYIFKVKAYNAAGVVAEKDIIVIITPPWWRTWWAYVLYSIILGVIVYAVYLRRINHLKRKQHDQIKVMVATQEGERKRISRDLHDDVGTKLSALKLSLSSLHEKATDINNEEIKSLTENAEQFITEVMQDVRQLLLNLSPAVLEEFGYTTAIEGLVNKINETKQLHFDLVIFGMKQSLLKDYELALYRITQELINNVLKHAEATNVALQIGHRDDKIILMIEDDGKGFDISVHKEGYGLHNLDARTRLMNGTMTIDSQIGKGTSVLIEIPYNFN